jgi:hypothetical protein
MQIKQKGHTHNNPNSKHRRIKNAILWEFWSTLMQISCNKERLVKNKFGTYGCFKANTNNVSNIDFMTSHVLAYSIYLVHQKKI